MFFFSNRFDVHSVIHFVGCYALVPTFISFGASLNTACGIALVCGIAWEALDEINCLNSWKKWFLDSRGADILDILTDFAGVLLAYWVF